MFEIKKRASLNINNLQNFKNSNWINVNSQAEIQENCHGYGKNFLLNLRRYEVSAVRPAHLVHTLTTGLQWLHEAAGTIILHYIAQITLQNSSQTG